MTRSPTRLARRLQVVLAALMGVVLVVGVAGAATLISLTSRLDRFVEELTPAIEANGDALQAVVDAETGVHGYLVSGDESLLEPFRGSRNRAEAHLGTVEHLAADVPSVAPLLTRQREAVAVWFDDYAEPTLEAGPEGDGPPADAGKALLDEVRRVHAALSRALQNERADLLDETHLLRRAGPAGVIGLTMIGLLVAWLVAMRTVSWTVRPTARLAAVVEQLRRGSTSVRADADHGPAEVRDVARAINTFADDSDRLRAAEVESARLRRAATEAARAVRAELEAAEAARAAVAAVATALGVDHVWARAVDDDGTYTSPLAVWSAPGQERVDPGDVEPLTIAGAGRLWRTAGGVLAVDDVSSAHADSRPPELQRAVTALASRTGATALVSAPLAGGDDVLGVLTAVTTHGPRAFTPSERTLLLSVGADLGRALEHAALFEQQAELVDRLQDLDRQKTDFLATVSHELRTPLTSISGYAEMVRDGDVGPVTAQMDHMLQVIGRNTERLRMLIDDLLMLSRIESGTFRSRPTVLDVAALLSASEQAVSPTAQAAGVPLVVEPGPPDLRVFGDELQLERVLLNLLSNAIKFTPPPGGVRLSAAVVDGRVEIRCVDEGIGIPAAEQQHLFDRFFRASNATAQAIPGTGLGLVIVQGVLERHGGSLEVRSQEGVGTTATVRLPLHPPDAAARTPLQVTPTHADPVAGPGRTPDTTG